MSQGYPTQLALRLLRHPKGRSDPTDCNAGGLSLLSGPRDKDGGRLTTFSRPGPRLVGGLGESTEALQNTPQACSLGTLAQLLAQGWMSWRDSGKRPGSTSYLTLRLMATTPLLSPHCHFLMVGCQWQGPLLQYPKLIRTHCLEQGTE